MTMALTLRIIGLSVPLLGLAACGSSGLAQLCDIEGDCEDWSSSQQDACEAKAERLDDAVESKGCQAQADALLSCSESAGCDMGLASASPRSRRSGTAASTSDCLPFAACRRTDKQRA